MHGGRTTPEAVSQLGDGLAVGGDQVVVHALVVGEHGGGGPYLSPHVADGAHACTAPRPLGESTVHATARPASDAPLWAGGASKARGDVSGMQFVVVPSCSATCSSAACGGLCSCGCMLQDMQPRLHVRKLAPTHVFLCTQPPSSQLEGTCAGDVVHARAVVLHNGASAALDCEDAGHLADDVLGRAPLGQLAGQPHANHLPHSPNVRKFKICKTAMLQVVRCIHGGSVQYAGRGDARLETGA